MNRKSFLCALMVATCLSTMETLAKRASFGMRSSRTYTKKAPNAGFGKPSKVNRLPKTKTITGHTKRTSKGYTYVNPYARSK